MTTIRPARISRGAIIAGQFRLERLLGQGGMSVVWAARDLQSGRPVAVKLLGPEAMAKPQLRHRFSREARITRRIRSPHVAQIFADGVTSAGVPFVAMELLEGESLAAHLAHVGRCSLVTAGAVMEQVCRALSSAHVVGLVHRDVKPANIFLTQQPHGELVVRLLDFGLAKEVLFASGLRQAGEVLGTADYMSPEQLCSPESVSSAADIWSLGVVLYEMLTGRRPFDENTFPLLALRIAEGAFLPPSRVCPDLPKAVDAVVAGALARDPKQRYATAAELGSAFLRVVRMHCSDSIVRPHVLGVLQAYDERSQANEPAQDHVPIESTGEDESTLRERWLSVLLVGLCIAVVFTSWLAASTLDDERAGTARSVGKAHAAETSAAAALSSQPSAADEHSPTAAAPLPSAAALATPLPALTGSLGAPGLPPIAAPMRPMTEGREASALPPLAAAPAAPTPPLTEALGAPGIPPTAAAPAAPTPPLTEALGASGMPPTAAGPTAPSAPRPSPRKPAKPKRVDKPADPQWTAPERRAPEPPPTAAAPLSKESKYGF